MWQSSVLLEVSQAGEELRAVFDVGWDKGSQFLKPVVQPAAQIIEQSPTAAHNWPHFPRGFVHFGGHPEFGSSPFGFVVGGIQEGKFGG